MDLAAVLLARVYTFLDIYELNPNGRVYYPKLAGALVNRYGFTTFPQKPEDFDESKGVKFLNGRIGNTTIDQVIIYNNGILLDTRISTAESKALLHEALFWASGELGLNYREGMIKQTHYVSQLAFRSNSPLQKISPALNRAAEKVSSVVSETAERSYKYEVTGVTVNFDQLTAVRKPFALTLERRENSPFSENKYFSQAPLDTQEHIDLIEALESSLAG
jgi:hypothetical protein